MASPELSRKAARLFNEYKAPLDLGFDWAMEIAAAENESDLSPELQAFLENPYYLQTPPEHIAQEVTNMKTPMERLKYAMNCKPMKSKEAAEAYLKIASMCKAFDEMPIPMQNYITQAEEEFGYEAPESIV